MCCAVSLWIRSLRMCTPMGQEGDDCHSMSHQVRSSTLWGDTEVSRQWWRRSYCRVNELIFTVFSTTKTQQKLFCWSGLVCLLDPVACFYCFQCWNFAFVQLLLKHRDPPLQNSNKRLEKQPFHCICCAWWKSNLISPNVSPSVFPGSFLWEKNAPYLPMSAQPVVYDRRGGEIEVSLTIQVSGLLPLRTNGYSYTICYLQCS